MIKAIIFDCFGVLTTDGWLPFKERMFGHDKSLYDQATDLNKQADSGFLAYGEYVHEIALLAGVTDKEVDTQLASNVTNEALFGYIQDTLKPNYAIGLLSNSGMNWLETLFTKQQAALFDAVVLSYQIGMVKPDPRMYTAIAEKLAVNPAECIFIDDQERYVTGAQDAGMPAIYYQNFEQMKADLEKKL